MSLFQAAVTATLNTICTQIAISDNSNYDAASDLPRSFFTAYRYVSIAGRSGFLYTYGSFNPNDGSNAPIAPAYPSGNDNVTWTNTNGDGVYYVQLITVPTYEVAATALYTFLVNQYWYSTTTGFLYQCIQQPAAAWISQNYTVGQQVYYTDGNFYQCILNTTSSQNPTNTTYWEMIPTQNYTNAAYFTQVQQSIVAGSSIYAATAVVVSTCSISQCYANTAQGAICGFGADGCGVGSVSQSSKFLNAQKLAILLDNIAAQQALSNYVQVSSDISAALGICSTACPPNPAVPGCTIC